MLRRSKWACKRLTPPYTWFHVALQQTILRRHATRLSTQKPQEIPSMLTAEQIVAAQKANLETLFDLTNKAFEGVEKLVELNLQVAKASLTEVQSTASASLGVKDAQELLALQAGLLQPAAEKAAAYGRHLYDIAASTNAEVTKVAEAQVAAAQAKFNSTIDSAVKNAPAGTESAAALVKSAIAAATNALETVQKASKQAADVAEANFQTLTNTAVKATQTTTKAAKKTAA
jgi:phasin family protein